MKHEDVVTLRGTVGGIFAHRFVLATRGGRVLADLTPQGATQIRLHEGDEFEIVGEQKPSEVKVRRIMMKGRETVAIERESPRRRHRPYPHGDADRERALRSARSEGLIPVGRSSP